MKTFNSLDVTVDIWDTSAEITRHKNGDVTIKHPYTKWNGSDTSASLAFNKIALTGNDAIIADRVFSDNPPQMEEYGDIYDLGYFEFIDLMYAGCFKRQEGCL